MRGASRWYSCSGTAGGDLDISVLSRGIPLRRALCEQFPQGNVESGRQDLAGGLADDVGRGQAGQSFPAAVLNERIVPSNSTVKIPSAAFSTTAL